jgi:large subunit ribosomal protein L17
MRHGNSNRKFGRKANVRRGFIRSLAVALITYETIKTTEARAKELRPYIEKLITLGKPGDVQSRRLIRSRLGNQETLANKLVDTLSTRFKDRQGGYTRITKLPNRKGDASPMAVIEFV